jgi:hypothetical protein
MYAFCLAGNVTRHCAAENAAATLLASKRSRIDASIDTRFPFVRKEKKRKEGKRRRRRRRRRKKKENIETRQVCYQVASGDSLRAFVANSSGQRNVDARSSRLNDQRRQTAPACVSVARSKTSGRTSKVVGDTPTRRKRRHGESPWFN